MADRILEMVERYWGYTALRPLQHEAMTAAVQHRDCLAVMPTGGGKSLCYQAPSLLTDKLTVVVSPLIALMKDQVDRLNERNIPAAFLNSSMDLADKRRVMAGIYNHRYRMIFIAPERFAKEAFHDMLARAGVGAFAIDEAHCISHWGHDFRADYRRLGELKQRYPDACVHAFTATATTQVRGDIIDQLRLDNPLVLVGDFFRPNLVYRVQPRTDAFSDVREAIRERPGQAGIVYCIRRDDVDELAARLRRAGIRATGYHAGMDDEARTAAQDAFARGEFDVVVATVAFGMGIDRADIRFVIHAAMPKSLEHYQQETGRAGRDGLRADCILFYASADYQLWKNIVEGNEAADLANKLSMLREMHRFCTGMGCRHRQLVTYFGQAWNRGSCEACDICGGTVEVLPESTVIAQKILSAVARTDQRFGAGYVTDILLGEATDKVIERDHAGLSVFGLLAGIPRPAIMTWIDQLADQGLLVRDGEYRVLKITHAGWQTLRSQAEARLTRAGPARSRKSRSRAEPKPAGKPARKKSAGAARTAGRRLAKRKGDKTSWAGRPMLEAPAGSAAAPMDDETRLRYNRLRQLRRSIARENDLPEFMVFSDKAIREIARLKPAGHSELACIRGVGAAKAEAYGSQVLEVIGTGAGQK
jgi:ATP-dependent DNA helicase RecQ